MPKILWVQYIKILAETQLQLATTTCNHKIQSWITKIWLIIKFQGKLKICLHNDPQFNLIISTNKGHLINKATITTYRILSTKLKKWKKILREKRIWFFHNWTRKWGFYTVQYCTLSLICRGIRSIDLFLHTTKPRWQKSSPITTNMY